MDQMSGTPSTPAASAGTTNELALHRTLLAHERTMLAWVRTATSLISFGFSIQQLFRSGKLLGAAPDQLIGPSEVGSAMTIIGLLALLLAAIEQRAALRDLREQYPLAAGYPPIKRSRARILAALIGLLGLAALLVRLVRI
jgi:putative membrane protein